YAAAWQLDAHRIDEASVDQNFIVQVRASGQAGRTDKADHLALPHAHAFVDAACKGAHVSVCGFVAVGVANADIFAVAGFPARLLDDTIARGVDRRTGRPRPIDAGMHLGVAEDRMVADAEPRTH